MPTQDEFGGWEIDESESDEFGGVSVDVVEAAPERGLELPEGLAEQLRKQDEFQQNLRAYTGGSPMSPGGPDMEFARSLYGGAAGAAVKAGDVIGETLHTVMKPIEAATRPLFQTLRSATAPANYGMTGEFLPELKPGESVLYGLEPPADARGVIPSVRRAAAGMTTPGAMALLPVAGGGGAIAKGVQGAFALGAGAAIPGGIQSFIEADTPAEKRGAATDVALSTLFAGMIGREAVRPRVSKPIKERTSNAIQTKAETVLRDVQQLEIPKEGAREMPAEVSSPKAAEALTPEEIARLDTERAGKSDPITAEKWKQPVPESMTLESVVSLETPKVEIEGKSVPIGEATVRTLASELRRSPERSNEILAKWAEADRARQVKLEGLMRDFEGGRKLTVEEITQLQLGQYLREPLQEIGANAEAIGIKPEVGREAWRLAEQSKAESLKRAIERKAAPVEKTKEEAATGFTPEELQGAITGDPMGFGEPSFMVPKEPPRPPPPREPGGAIEFPTEGENVKMRKSAERATTSPDIPEPVQETIKTAPESFYKQQSMAKVEDIVSTMNDADLAIVPRDSNLYTAARLEQAGRLFKEGKNDAGYDVFVELEKEGTRLGQLINQFKLLKGTRPEEVARVIDKTLEKSGKDPLKPQQREEAIKKAEKSKEADRKLDEATEDWAKNPTPENAAKAEKSLLDANEAGLELQRFVGKYQPRSLPAILKSILQGNLLTPISQARNIVGNMAFSPLRAGTRTIGAGFDVINNYLTGSKRTVTVQPIRGTAEAIKGFGRGAKQIPDIFLRGTGDTIKGETRAGLHPIKAWINQFSKNPEMPTIGGRITLQDRLNLAIEGTLGIPAEAMLRGLGAGDVAFKEAAKARATATELALANVPKDQWSFAQKFPELFLDETAMARMQAETLQAVFQRPSKTLNLVTNWIRGRGDWFDLAVATVAPYKLTPWNIIGEILSYNPLIAAARSVHSSKIKNPREARLNAGKFVVGSMLTAAGWWLYKNGLMSPSLDQRDESQKSRVLAGEVLPPNHINLSGLERAMNGGDPAFKAGDETVDVFSAGGLAGAMFYMTANIGRDFERMPAVPDSEVWGAILRQSTLEQARFGMNQSFLSGVEGLLSAVREGNTDNYVRQWGNTVASIPLPNSLTVMSRASREYKPDFREDTFRKQMENIVRNKLGVANLDDYLPLKRGLWGEPMRETPEGRNAILYHFFDVFKNRQVTSDPVPLELFRLWRKTADTRVIPSLPEKTITMGGNTYALDAAQQSRYAELVGKSRRAIVDAVAVNPNFHKLPDESKVEILDRIYRAGLQRGKAEFWREIGGGLKLKPSRAGFLPPE